MPQSPVWGMMDYLIKKTISITLNYQKFHDFSHVIGTWDSAFTKI